MRTNAWISSCVVHVLGASLPRTREHMRAHTILKRKMSIHIEYAGIGDVKEEVLKILERNWRSISMQNLYDLTHDFIIMLSSQLNMYPDSIDITSVPRDFNFKKYIGLYVNDGISALITLPSGEIYLFNVTMQSWDEIEWEDHFRVHYEE